MKKHHCQIKTRWGDLDAFGHVNNAAYLVYLQEARLDFTWYARKAEGPIPLAMVVARAEIDFVAGIYDGDKILDVTIWVGRVGNASFTLKYEISEGEKVYARAETVQVCVDEKTHESKPLTKEEREFLLQYLEAGSES